MQKDYKKKENVGKIIVSPNEADPDFFDVWTVELGIGNKPFSKLLFTIYCDDRELLNLPLTQSPAMFEAPRWIEIGDFDA